jgi:hypothetical protein
MSYLTLADLGAYADYAWFVNERNNAKTMAARTGNVDGARKLVDDALRAWQGGPFNLGNDPTYVSGYQTPVDFATNAKNYIETYRSRRSGHEVSRKTMSPMHRVDTRREGEAST